MTIGEAAPPQPDESPGLQPPLPPRREQFVFTGTGGEYFRIWIVNLLLTVVTLGIYSAWAKVRRLQYFYRHTRVAGASFDYHARPLAILKGRAIGACLFGSYYVAGAFSPIAAMVALAILVALLPFFICQSFRFRFHNSSYRGLRFGFLGTVREAYWVFLGLPLLMVMSLFTLAPFWYHRLKRYQHAHARYGGSAFGYDAAVGAFYRIYLKVGLAVLVVTLMIGATAALVAAAAGSTARQAPSGPLLVIFMAIPILFYVVVLGAWAYTTASIQNLVWSHTHLGPHRFECALEPGHLFGIILTNLLGVVFTIGLFTPFARVRLTRCFTEALALRSVGTLDDVVGAEAMAVSALGQEVLDIFDIDLGF